MPAANDAFASAVLLTGSSGSTAVDTDGATSEAGEPVHGVNSATAVNSVWYYIAVADPSDVVLTTLPTTFNTVMDLWAADTGDTVATLDRIAVSDDVNGFAPEIAFTASVDTTYYIRVYPYAAGDFDATATLTWTVTTRTDSGDLVVTAVDDVLPFAPGLVVVTVANGEPEAAVEFTIDSSPTVVASDELDDTGSILAGPVPIGDVTAGTHTIHVTAGADTGSVDFTVLAADADDDDAPAADVEPTTTVTDRWVFYDSVTDVAHPFVVNPATSGSPIGPWTIETEPTSAPDGQVVVWQGIRPGHPWQFAGWLLTQEEVESLRTVADIRHRIWLVNHLSEGFVVVVDDVKMKRARDAQRPWLHTYDMTVIVLQGPVQL